MAQENKNRIDTVVETALKNLSSIIDVNTVVGKPVINENGDYYVPVSKITLGVLSGGGEYGKLCVFKKSDDLPFSAGNGTVVSIKPCGFLIKEKGSFKLLSVGDSYEKLIDAAMGVVEKIKGEN